MFQVKICGITSHQDAQAAVAAGADAIGMNFHPKSPRFVSAEQASEAAGDLPSSVARIGVFVNASIAEIEDAASRFEFWAVQLHGDEPPELLAQLPRELKIIRAVRLGDAGLSPLADYLARCRAAGRIPDALLVDAHSATAYGGTGQTVDWQRVIDDRPLLEEIPLILAGGLEPGNVARAIATVRPAAVDVASGVESTPGRKDVKKLTTFIATAKKAFARSDNA